MLRIKPTRQLFNLVPNLHTHSNTLRIMVRFGREPQGLLLESYTTRTEVQKANGEKNKCWMWSGALIHTAPLSAPHRLKLTALISCHCYSPPNQVFVYILHFFLSRAVWESPVWQKVCVSCFHFVRLKCEEEQNIKQLPSQTHGKGSNRDHCFWK